PAGSESPAGKTGDLAESVVGKLLVVTRVSVEDEGDVLHGRRAFGVVGHVDVARSPSERGVEPAVEPDAAAQRRTQRLPAPESRVHRLGDIEQELDVERL